MKSDTLYHIILSVLSDEATDEERCTLSEWLAASDANKTEFEKIKRLYLISSGSGKKEKQVGFDVDRAWNRVELQTVNKKNPFEWRRWLSYAAMLILVAGIGFYFISERPTSGLMGKVDLEEFDEPTLLLDNGEKIPLKRDSFSIRHENTVIRNYQSQLSYLTNGEDKLVDKEEERLNHIVIPKGNAYELTLADGTHVWLNAESELIFPTRFTGKERRVTLKGEGYFDVIQNPDKPFYVETNGVEVKVLGTAFNVSGYVGERTASVTLVRGLVSVETSGGKQFRITPSERLTWDKQTAQTNIQKVNTDLYTSWIEGKYIFKEATLDEILEKLHHWYDFSVDYQNKQLGSRKFSLVVDRKVSLDQLLEIISYTSDVKLVRNGNSIHVKEVKEGKI